MMDKAIAAGGKLLSPSGEKTIKELAARGEVGYMYGMYKKLRNEFTGV